VKDDTQETGRRGRYFRYAVLALGALLVLSLGFVLIPREPPAPAAPPFSEQARAQAFADSLALRAAGMVLEGAADGALPAAQSAALGRAVTLLTVQARALMLSADVAGSNAAAAPPAAPVPPPSTPADLAAALQASGAQRLKDAETADGGMARLLAGAGTAQLLAAEDLARAAGIPLAALPAAPPTDVTVPGNALPGGTGTAPPSLPTASCVSGSLSSTADLGSAVASVVAEELELVYAYQAALTRLGPASAGPASDFLTRHGVLRGQAEAMSRSHCVAVPLRQPGYGLSPAFLADPAAGLGTLEAGTLPVLGDVVALSVGSDRAWAVSALESAARRTVHWGATPGPVPGVVLAESLLPELPEAAPAPGPSTTGPRPSAKP
jgi:hypothetical protein